MVSRRWHLYKTFFANKTKTDIHAEDWVGGGEEYPLKNQLI